MRVSSIRLRLLAGIAAVQVVAAVLAIMLVVRHERAQSYSMLDADLVDRSATLKSVIEPPDDPAARAILHRELLTLPKEDVYVLMDTRGQVIATSRALRTLQVLEGRSQVFVDRDIDGQRYRVLVEQGITMFDDDPKEMARLPKLILLYGSPEARVDAHVRHVAWGAAGIGLAILVLSLAAAASVIRAGLRPVKQLAARAATINAMHWEWEAPGDGREAEELAPLATALTHLVERLRTAFVRERQFSADAAHEMKTAVAIVKSTLQLTLERAGGAPEYRAGVERALEDSERMQGLVTGMLQLAKVEGMAGPSAEKAMTADVLEQVRAAVRGLAPLLDARRVRVEIDASEPSMPVQISAEGLGLVIANLLENAIHYSPDGSAIRVKVDVREATCILSLSDEGCGIDADALPHIFERFYRGDASRSRESGGAGLGLAIVQAIVRRAGGTVTVESQAGVGSVFTVTLPRA